MFFLSPLLCLSPFFWSWFTLLLLNTKYHYSIIHLLYFSLFVTVISIFFPMLLYCTSFICYLAACLLHSCIPLFLSELSLICSLRNEFLKKSLVSCALHWAWCNTTPEWLTEHGNSESALHDNCVGGGGISSSIMSFVCTNYSTFYSRCPLPMWYYTCVDAFTVVFCCIVLHADALSFHITFLWIPVWYVWMCIC